MGRGSGRLSVKPCAELIFSDQFKEYVRSISLPLCHCLHGINASVITLAEVGASAPGVAENAVGHVGMVMKSSGQDVVKRFAQHEQLAEIVASRNEILAKKIGLFG